MAQKAAKATAKRNGQVLNRTHMIAAIINTVFILFRALIFRASFTRKSLILYILLASPALVIEFLFERQSRPKYKGDVDGGELRSSGEDLEAKGLTEWMWDVVYWTWTCIGLAALVGDRAWWLYLAVPAYSGWLAYTTFGSVQRGMSGLGGAANDGAASGASTSKRQQKMEKRGGQKAQYR